MGPPCTWHRRHHRSSEGVEAPQASRKHLKVRIIVKSQLSCMNAYNTAAFELGSLCKCPLIAQSFNIGLLVCVCFRDGTWKFWQVKWPANTTHLISSHAEIGTEIYLTLRPPFITKIVTQKKRWYQTLYHDSLGHWIYKWEPSPSVQGSFLMKVTNYITLLIYSIKGNFQSIDQCRRVSLLHCGQWKQRRVSDCCLQALNAGCGNVGFEELHNKWFDSGHVERSCERR